MEGELMEKGTWAAQDWNVISEQIGHCSPVQRRAGSGEARGCQTPTQQGSHDFPSSFLPSFLSSFLPFLKRFIYFIYMSTL